MARRTHAGGSLSRRGTLADRTYRQTAAVGIGTTALWTLVWLWLGMITLAWIGLIAMAVMLLARRLRFRLGYPAATRLSVCASLLVLVAGILQTGGMDGPFGLMMVILPLGPALALGPAESLRWGGVVLALGGGLWGWEAWQGPLPDLVPEGFARAFRGLAQLTVLCGTLLCLYTYGRMHETARQRLRSSRAELQDAHRDLQLSQQKLIVSEKMAALGRLTAGMAHEINSTLAGAINALELASADAEALRRARDGPEADGVAAEIRESLALASTALEKLAAFVRRMRGQTTVGETEADNVFPAAEEADTVLRLLQVTLLEKRVTLRTEIARDNWLRGDPGRFGQVVQNLVSNAVDAHDGKPGTILVRLYREDRSVVLQVKDGGCGIPEAIRGRIFDHFFTTKRLGEGTGLGLALVHEIATRYFGGTIEFETEVGRGTCFTVRLPAAQEPPWASS